MRASPHLLAAALLAGCSTFDAPDGPVDDALVARLAAAPERAEFERWRARLTIESDELTTEAMAVAIVSTDGPPRLALQLIPALGGKVLDLRVGPTAGGGLGLAAEWPHAGRTLEADLAADAPGPSLELFLAASVLEAATPITLERTVAATPLAGGADADVALREVLLSSRFPGLTTVATVDAEGRVVRRRFERGRATWREAVEASGRVFAGRGIEVRIEDESMAGLGDVDEGLFEVDVE